jgi:hypothetical protein
MKKLSGLVLDQYDDAEGDVLRSIFPTEESIPGIIKQANHMAPEERVKLPATSFALELINGDLVMRKFACVDPGNTALSVEYFLKTGHKLPEEAQKVAAQNLVTACEWYEIEAPEELQKVALGVGSLFTAAMIPSIVKGTKEQIGSNMRVARASGGAVNPQLMNAKHIQTG